MNMAAIATKIISIKSTLVVLHDDIGTGFGWSFMGLIVTSFGNNELIVAF